MALKGGKKSKEQSLTFFYTLWYGRHLKLTKVIFKALIELIMKRYIGKTRTGERGMPIFKV